MGMKRRSKYMVLMVLLAAPVASAETRVDIEYNGEIPLTEDRQEGMTCRPCETAVNFGEKVTGFHLGSRVYPDQSLIQRERVIPEAPVKVGVGTVFTERAGAVRFINGDRSKSVQVWADVVPGNEGAASTSGKSSPGSLVVGAGVRMAF